MRGSRLGWVAGLLALVAVFGALATHSAPDGGHGIGIWPIGGATACFMISPRPRTWALVGLVGLIGVGSIWIGGRDLEVAIGLGIGLAAEAWVTWWILADGRRKRPPLRTTVDLARFLAAVGCGGLAMGAAGALTSALTGFGEPDVLGLTVAASSLLAQLTVVPFFCRLRNHAPLAGPTERTAQWVLLLAIAPIVFMPEDFPSIVFLVLPLLVWGALRSSPYESMAQLIAVLTFAVPLTTWGRGPFANAGPRFGLSVDGQGILLGTFGAVCALVVLPLVLAVGEQIENARQAAAERDKVQNIVNGAAGVAIIGTDDQGAVTLFNPGAERLLGYTAAEMLGDTTRRLHTPEAIAEKAAELGVENDFTAVARALLGTGANDMRFVRKDGVERVHSMSLNRIEDDRGVVNGYVSTSEDITDRIEAERRLVEAVERLREVDQVKDAFVSSVSHELRTPITSILGYTEMLEEGQYGELAPEQLDAVRRLSANSTRLLSLIDDLLTLSRVQEDGLSLADRVVDLRKIVAAGAAVVAPTLERRELELNVDLPDEPVPFLGDRDMLERVVINLVGNAVKFTPAGGRVDVSLLAGPDSAVVEVADTGIGIPPEEQERLFTRFFRSSLAQQQAIPGSGLGLSIARAIVDQHGGTMSVESEPGQGTTFRVRLPLLTVA
ncbi:MULTISPECIES: ATP-binding protein [unclassified Nocardioides]|uniref:ATP-binding protein n=1 Tax=Nocardioides sp. URHA0032 TaxID=1380388 RepID=UPI0018CC3B6A|nr:ATP-binding protein [Nocardioides sp. URHA0032]